MQTLAERYGWGTKSKENYERRRNYEEENLKAYNESEKI